MLLPEKTLCRPFALVIKGAYLEAVAKGIKVSSGMGLGRCFEQVLGDEGRASLTVRFYK